MEENGKNLACIMYGKQIPFEHIGSSGCTQINGTQINYLSTTTVHSIPPKVQLKFVCFFNQPTNNHGYKTEINENGDLNMSLKSNDNEGIKFTLRPITNSKQIHKMLRIYVIQQFNRS